MPTKVWITKSHCISFKMYVQETVFLTRAIVFFGLCLITLKMLIQNSKIMYGLNHYMFTVICEWSFFRRALFLRWYNSLYFIDVVRGLYWWRVRPKATKKQIHLGIFFHYLDISLWNKISFCSILSAFSCLSTSPISWLGRHWST